MGKETRWGGREKRRGARAEQPVCGEAGGVLSGEMCAWKRVRLWAEWERRGSQRAPPWRPPAGAVLSVHLDLRPLPATHLLPGQCEAGLLWGLPEAAAPLTPSEGGGPSPPAWGLWFACGLHSHFLPSPAGARPRNGCQGLSVRPKAAFRKSCRDAPWDVARNQHRDRWGGGGWEGRLGRLQGIGSPVAGTSPSSSSSSCTSAAVSLPPKPRAQCQGRPYSWWCPAACTTGERTRDRGWGVQGALSEPGRKHVLVTTELLCDRRCNPPY